MYQGTSGRERLGSQRGRRVQAEVDSTDCRSGDRGGRHLFTGWPVTTRARRASCRLVPALGAALGALLLSCSAAFAVSQRGHVFAFHFGSFSNPTGIAVNNATGDVYVGDGKRKRVTEFQPVDSGGQLVGETESSSWEAVSVPSPEAIAVDNSLESTDPSAGDVYVLSSEKAIYKFSAEGKQIEVIKAPGGSAVVKKFAAIKGLAVDTHGDLFVYQEDGKIFRFNNAISNEGVSGQVVPEAAAGRPGFAVDAEGDFYIGDQGEAGASELQSGLLREASIEYKETRTVEGTEPPFAVVAKLAGATDSILVPALDYEFTSGVAVNPFNEGGNEVDERDDAYVMNVAGVASERTTSVAAFVPATGKRETGDLIQRFSTPGLRDGDAIAVDGKTGAVYVADAASNSDNVDVFELERPGVPQIEDVTAASSVGTEVLSASVDPVGAGTDYYFEYGTSPCAMPSVCSETAPVNVGGGFGGQAARVELPGLQPGTYYYRVLAENEHGKTDGAERTFAVVATVTGLPDGRAWELVSPPDKDGAEPEALTREGGVIQAAENGSAITYVADGPMPAGAAVEGNRDPEYPQIFSTRGAKGWSSQDLATPVTQGTGVEVGAPPEYQFFSPNLALALVQPAVGAPESGSLADPPLAPGETQEKTMYLRAQQPIVGAEEFLPVQPSQSEKASYERAARNAEEGASLSPGYVALVTDLNPPGEGVSEFGGGLKEGVEFVSANADLSDAVLKSWRGERGLYEWTGVRQPLKKISILPESGSLVEPEHAFLGGPLSANSRNAISSGGSRVIWTTNNASSLGSGDDLFVRDTVTNETLQLDTFHGVSPQNASPNAVFQTADANGSKVFFTDTRRLTANSRATERSPNLYVAELEGGEVQGSQLTATLTDLTPQEGAKVQSATGEGGGVIGAGEEAGGELNVYFVADGVLAAGATPGYCRTEAESLVPPDTTCNLYVRHFADGGWEPAKFIAALSSEDQPDWLSTGQDDDLTELTSRVSPNGEFLAFMSNRSLTGYDNEDVSSERAKEARLDEEVYLYDASTGQISCASCNPTGERPTGVLDTKNAGEGIGLLASRPKTWELFGVDHWLAGSIPGWTSVSASDALYQSRYLSNEGRLFFNSADALVPIAKPTRTEAVNGEDQQVGVENVYEFEPSGLGGCTEVSGCVALISSGASESESAFLDASTTGNDVFFLTAQALSSQDKDSNFDIYDAHVCERTSSPCVSPAAKTATKCEEEGGEACQPYTPAPGFAVPVTSTLPGASNLVQQVHVLSERESVKPKQKPLTRAQKLAKALKACKKDTKKAKRVACDKHARKKYGSVKKKAAAKKSSGLSSR
jgi:NHL repeat